MNPSTCPPIPPSFSLRVVVALVRLVVELDADVNSKPLSSALCFNQNTSGSADSYSYYGWKVTLKCSRHNESKFGDVQINTAKFFKSPYNTIGFNSKVSKFYRLYSSSTGPFIYNQILDPSFPCEISCALLKWVIHDTLDRSQQ